MSTERPPIDDSQGADPVARVIEAAGLREDHAAAIDSLRAAARAAWLEGLERRRLARAVKQRRALSIAAGLLLLAAAGWVAVGWKRDGMAPPASAAVATVLRVDGEANTVEPSGETRRLVVGAAVRAGDRLETTAGSRAALALGDLRSLRLDRDTAVTLAAADRLELERGAVYLASENDARGAVAVATPLGIAREVGTRFAVELRGGRVMVSVRTGAVVLEHEDERLAVPAGEQLSRAADGGIVRRMLFESDPSWEWTAAVAPPFELEGATTGQYLSWLASETGWRIAYDDAEAARAVSTSVQHGSLAGLDPRDTPDAVLPSAGLEYRLEGDVLHVRTSR